MYIIFHKFITFIATKLSSLVYNFHKPIKGIKTKRNKHYKTKGYNSYQRVDIHYHKDYKTSKPRPCIVYFHGGGWCCYSKSIFSTLSRRLAKMGYVVFNVNYSLAPLYKMDKIIADCVLALNYVQKHAHEYGGDPTKLVLGGDSAGAHLSSLLAGYINSGEIDMSELKGRIKALILFYGVYDINTMQTTGFPNIRTYVKSALRGKGRDLVENAKYSPINYIDSHFPPCILASGAIDKLHSSQSAEFYKLLQSKGIKAQKVFFEKKEARAVHAYMIFDGLETNVITLNKVQEFLKEVI